jgi:hypothetical protein
MRAPYPHHTLRTPHTQTVKFIGRTQFKAGIWVGVDLDQAIGKNDGTVQGVDYFKAGKNHGLFTRSRFVQPIALRKMPPAANGTTVAVGLEGKGWAQGGGSGSEVGGFYWGDKTSRESELSSIDDEIKSLVNVRQNKGRQYAAIVAKQASTDAQEASKLKQMTKLLKGFPRGFDPNQAAAVASTSAAAAAISSGPGGQPGAGGGGQGVAEGLAAAEAAGASQAAAAIAAQGTAQAGAGNLLRGDGGGGGGGGGGNGGGGGGQAAAGAAAGAGAKPMSLKDSDKYVSGERDKETDREKES